MLVSGRSWIIPMSFAALLTAGCSTVESVTGFLTGSESTNADSTAPAASAAERPAAVESGPERPRASQAERTEAASRLKGAAAAETAAYNGTVQDIADKLRSGTGPRSPQLLEQWTEARSHLARVDEIVARMRALDAQAAGGDDDLKAEIGRQTAWLAAERPRSDGLLAAIRSGGNAAPSGSTAGRATPTPIAGPTASAGSVPAAPVAAVPASTATSAFRPVSIDGRKTFVVIRFPRDDVEYERALYEALQVAVNRSPKIRFDVVAVTPRGGTFDTKRTDAYADRVAKSMRGMGLSEGQVRTYDRQINGISEPQVHVYVRRR